MLFCCSLKMKDEEFEEVQEEKEQNDEDGVFWPTQSLSRGLLWSYKLLSTTSPVGCRSRRPPPW